MQVYEAPVYRLCLNGNPRPVQDLTRGIILTRTLIFPLALTESDTSEARLPQQCEESSLTSFDVFGFWTWQKEKAA